MKIGSMIGWGIVIYAVMYLMWNGLVLYGFVDGIVPRLISLSVLVVTATIAGRSLRFTSAKDVAPYSIAWAIVVVLLDMVYTVPYAGWALYSDWNIWVGYALVAASPLVAPYIRGFHRTP